MILKFSGDFDWESRVGKIVTDLNSERGYFEEKEYGESIKKVFIVLMCSNPDFNFKQRTRFSKDEHTLYADIMLDLKQFKIISHTDRERIIAEKLLSEIPAIVLKYKFKNFDLERFKIDLKGWFEKLKWI